MKLVNTAQACGYAFIAYLLITRFFIASSSSPSERPFTCKIIRETWPSIPLLPPLCVIQAPLSTLVLFFIEEPRRVSQHQKNTYSLSRISSLIHIAVIHEYGCLSHYERLQKPTHTSVMAPTERTFLFATAMRHQLTSRRAESSRGRHDGR